jgi:hypothetical protein
VDVQVDGHQDLLALRQPSLHLDRWLGYLEQGLLIVLLAAMIGAIVLARKEEERT